MSLLGTKAGDAYLLSQAAGLSADTKLVLHLSTNARTPTYDDTPGSWTEASGSGYTTVDLDFSAVTVFTADPFSYWQWAVQTYGFTGAINITGYWISDPGNNYVVSAEQISPAWSFGSLGGPATIQPTIGLQ